MTDEIRYKHYRNIGYDFGQDEHFFNKGGVTIAYVYIPDDCHVYEGQQAILIGFAACSLDDNFDKKKGREIAEDRLFNLPVALVGTQEIRELLSASEPYEVAELLGPMMQSRGLRLDLCA